MATEVVASRRAKTKPIDNFTTLHYQSHLPVDSSSFVLPDFPVNFTDISAPGGGRLQYFVDNWLQIGVSDFVYNVIKYGYKIQFMDTPQLTVNANPFALKLPATQQVILDKELNDFVTNKVIEPCDPKTPGFYSPVFFREKPRHNPDDPIKYRVIIDLSRLNKMIDKKHFKMESTNTIRNTLQIGDYFFTADLTMAYNTIPMHKSSRKYLRFWWNSQAWEFVAMPFGLTSAPWLFSLVMAEMSKYFHKHSIQCVFYLDDLLFKNQDYQQLLHDHPNILYFLQALGWLINFEKSNLDLVSRGIYVGTDFDLQAGMVYPPPDRWSKLQYKLATFFTVSQASAHQWSSLLGTITSCQDLTPLGRLHARDLQIHVNKHWKDRSNTKSDDPRPRVSPPISQMVDRSLQCHVWHPPTASTPHNGNVVGREQDRLGSSHPVPELSRESRCLRNLDTGTTDITYQLPRASVCSSVSTAFRGYSDKSECSSSHRQCFSTNLCEQAQRFKEPLSTPNLSGTAKLVSPQEHSSSSCTHQGHIQCSQRLSQQKRIHCEHGVVNTSVYHDHDQTSLDRSSHDRPFCHQAQQKTAPLCVTSSRPCCHGNRCTVSQLGQLPSLRISSPVHHTTGFEQSENTSVHHISDRPQLAQDVLVPPNVGLTSRHTEGNSVSTQTVETARDRNFPSSSEQFQSTRLQVIVHSLIARGFSPETATAISQKNRSGSEQCYEKYWQRYLHWCKRVSANPLLAPVTVIADFLNDFIQQQSVVPTTLDCIKSCVTLTIKLCTEIDYTSNMELSALLCKYHKDCPPELFQLPSWNLVLVLDMMGKYPFEPLYKASLKHLTYKCVFLISMACSCRISEVHAFSFDKLSHSENWDKVYLEPKSDFLAKNQKSHAAPARCFTLKALVPAANRVDFVPGSPEEQAYNTNKLYCPVRALRFYLSRTRSRRSKHKSALFVSLQENRRNDITKQSIGNWVRHAIKLCYALAGDNEDNIGRATVHEIRAVTSSVKFERNLSLESVLKSCVWKNHNTFTRYYLRNVAVLSQNLYKFPPLFVSQSTINE